MAVTVQERLAMLRFFDSSCVRCFASGRMTLDHVVPRKYGGPDHVSNLQPMCRRCNAGKGHGERVDYRPWAACVLGKRLPPEYRLLPPLTCQLYAGETPAENP